MLLLLLLLLYFAQNGHVCTSVFAARVACICVIEKVCYECLACAVYYVYNAPVVSCGWCWVRLPADAVFVQTGDNVQRIYVPRQPEELPVGSTPVRAVTADTSGDGARAVESTAALSTPTVSTAVPNAARLRDGRSEGRSEGVSTHAADKRQHERQVSPMETPPRSARRKEEGEQSTSSPQSTGRRRRSPQSHQIYSPVAGLLTPSRQELRPASQSNQSTNQTPSPGVAFARRGAQSAGKAYRHVPDDINAEASNSRAAAPTGRFHTTTKLDTLREESWDDARSTHREQSPGRGSGASVLEAEEDTAPPESRRLFCEDSTVITVHSDSIRQDEAAWYCPLCSARIVERGMDDVKSIELHLIKVRLSWIALCPPLTSCACVVLCMWDVLCYSQCVRNGDNLHQLQRFEKALQSVLVHLPTGRQSPAQHSTLSTSPHPETSLVMHDSPLSYHVSCTVTPVDVTTV